LLIQDRFDYYRSLSRAKKFSPNVTQRTIARKISGYFRRHLFFQLRDFNDEARIISDGKNFTTGENSHLQKAAKNWLFRAAPRGDASLPAPSGAKFHQGASSSARRRPGNAIASNCD
jgi:hypothetical protein